MNTSEYLTLAGRTDLSPVQEENAILRIADRTTINSLHYTMGISTEAGELLDVMKKYLAYGKDVDLVNVKEEIGDVLWYVARLIKLHNWTFEEIMEMNINKLFVRFPHKFAEEDAVNRNLLLERNQLEADMKA